MKKINLQNKILDLIEKMNLKILQDYEEILELKLNNNFNIEDKQIAEEITENLTYIIGVMTSNIFYLQDIYKKISNNYEHYLKNSKEINNIIEKLENFLK